MKRAQKNPQITVLKSRKNETHVFSRRKGLKAYSPSLDYVKYAQKRVGRNLVFGLRSGHVFDVLGSFWNKSHVFFRVFRFGAFFRMHFYGLRASGGVQLHVIFRCFLFHAFQIVRFYVLFAPGWAPTHAFFAGIALCRERKPCIFTGQSDTRKSPSMRIYGVLAFSSKLKSIEMYAFYAKKCFAGCRPGLNSVKYA